MKRAATAVAALILLAVAAATTGSKVRAPLLGAVWGPGGAKLVWLDPLTLSPAATKRVLIGATALLTWSRDRSRVALGGENAAVLVVDAKRMRLVGIVRLGSGWIPAGIWTRFDRLIVIRATDDGEVAVVDPRTMRLRERRRLGGSVLAAVASGSRIVVLLGQPDAIGPLRLAVVDAQGRARTVPLPSIHGGWTRPEGTSAISEQANPGLAVDPSGRRVAVVAADGLVVEVDLGSLTASAHQTAIRTTAARTKAVDAWNRSAEWVSPTLLAVTGWNAETTVDGTGERQRWSPAGLAFVDTRSWKATSAEPGASSLAKAGDVLLAYDGFGSTSGMGLRGYALDGSLRFHLFEREAISDVQVARGLAYVAGCNRRCFRIVDPALGRVIGEVRTKTPVSLLG